MKKLKAAHWLLFFTGLISILIGIWMLFTPFNNLILVSLYIGLSMLVSGLSEIITFTLHEKDSRSSWLLASGIFSSLFGLWVIIGQGSHFLSNAIPFIFAAWIMTNGVIRMIGAQSQKADGWNLWGWMMALGILATLCGFILLFSPIVSATIVSFMIAFMFINYGINQILIFYKIKKVKCLLVNIWTK